MTDSANLKSKPPNDHFRLPDAPDEYAIAPEKSRASTEPAPMPAAEADLPPTESEDRQFTLGELLGLVAVLSVVLSILTSIARWLGWANSPAGLAAVFALAFGVGTFFGLIFVAGATNARPIARVGVWVLLGGYILCAA